MKNNYVYDTIGNLLDTYIPLDQLCLKYLTNKFHHQLQLVFDNYPLNL